MTLTIEMELLLAFGLVCATTPLHEYGHKLALRVLGFDSHIIWWSRVNDHWWGWGASCVPEEAFDNYRGTLLEHAFVYGSGGAVQAIAFMFPILLLEAFGLFTIMGGVCLIYMFCEIISGCRSIEWEPDDQKEGSPP